MNALRFATLFLICLTATTYGQVSISADPSSPDPSAMLDVKSTSMGLLLPRMTMAQRNVISNPAEGLIIFCTDCNLDGSGLLSMVVSGQWLNLTGFCQAPAVPAAGTHVAALTQITWNWNAVPDAAGYKWNTADNIATATDMGLLTSKTEDNLSCGTSYTRYVWAYNECGKSSPVILTQSTLICSGGSCGDPITINHLASGGVAPVDKTVTYGTVTGIPGATSKCWITRNLGASQQATAVNDATEASAGWYWQFNRKQGFKHDGTTRTPNTTWISNIHENSDWTIANDPCSLELGAGWRLPTSSEWQNVDNTGGWSNWNGPWNSALKMHAGGYLSWTNGSVASRGGAGNYWSSTQWTGSFPIGHGLFFTVTSCFDNGSKKADGLALRCLKDN